MFVSPARIHTATLNDGRPEAFPLALGEEFDIASKKGIREISMAASSLRATRVSFAAAAAFVVLFAVLHVIKPELDPSWRMGSEYAIGDYGWVMQIAMLALALSCAALFGALRPEIETTGGRIALDLLLVS